MNTIFVDSEGQEGCNVRRAVSAAVADDDCVYRAGNCRGSGGGQVFVSTARYKVILSVPGVPLVRGDTRKLYCPAFLLESNNEFDVF